VGARAQGWSHCPFQPLSHATESHGAACAGVNTVNAAQEVEAIRALHARDQHRLKVGGANDRLSWQRGMVGAAPRVTPWSQCAAHVLDGEGCAECGAA